MEEDSHRLSAEYPAPFSAKCSLLDRFRLSFGLEYWGNDWYDKDYAYMNCVDNRSCLYNTSYPNVAIAISISVVIPQNWIVPWRMLVHNLEEKGASLSFGLGSARARGRTSAWPSQTHPIEMLPRGRRTGAAHVLLLPFHAQHKVNRGHEKVLTVGPDHDGID